MDPKTEKLIRRMTVAATVSSAYCLLYADYGPHPNALDPIKNAIESAKSSVKKFIFGSGKGSQESIKEENS